jgi:hypothetical protein
MTIGLKPISEFKGCVLLEIRATTFKTNKQTKNPKNTCWAPAPHACNPSYSGGRDQED